MNIDTLSEVIKYHRKQSGLTQKRLADLAGVGKTVIYDIEKGKETVQWDTIKKILSVLNIKIKFESPLVQVRMFDEFIKDFEQNLLIFAKENSIRNKELLLKDGISFIKEVEEDLKRWMGALVSGKLGKNDFEFMLKGKKHLAKMEALKEAGFANDIISKSANGIIYTTINSVTKMF